MSAFLRRLCLLGLLASCREDDVCAPAALTPLAATPTFVVVTSDYGSSAIALLDDNGALLTEAWIDSGTTSAGLSATIGGDVVLPSSQIDGQSLVLIDRLGVDVITQIAIPSGTVQRQIPTQRRNDSNVEDRFRANPYDVLAWSSGEWFVSRYAPNLRPEAAELDRGNDVVRIDPTTREIAARFSFDGANVESGGKLFYARPARMVRRGDVVLVALSRMDASFVTGPGALAVIDPETSRVVAHSLAPYRNCGEAVALPNDASRAFVLCSGDSFSDEDGRRGTAALLRVRVQDADTVTIERTWSAEDHRRARVPTNGLIALSSSRVAVNAMGDRSSRTTDALISIDLESDDYDVIFESTGSFVIGTGTWDQDRSLLIVPDAESGIHWIEVGDDGQYRLVKILDVSPCRGLPPREVRRLSSHPT